MYCNDFSVILNGYSLLVFIINDYDNIFIKFQCLIYSLSSGRPGFNPRSNHTKDSKNGT